MVTNLSRARTAGTSRDPPLSALDAAFDEFREVAAKAVLSFDKVRLASQIDMLSEYWLIIP